jgi:hypothetical protein
MASETFKKRQKETARREKKLKKAARLMERRNEKAKIGSKLEEEQPKTEMA